MTNFHSIFQLKYTRSVVTGFVQTLSCLQFMEYFQESLTKAEVILDKNQYPKSFYRKNHKKTGNWWRWRLLKNYSFSTQVNLLKTMWSVLKCINASCKVILTLKKMKSVLPFLTFDIEKALRSRAVYQMTCSSYLACYVGQRDWHLTTHFKEHLRPSKPASNNLEEYGVQLLFDNKYSVCNIQSTANSRGCRLCGNEESILPLRR